MTITIDREALFGLFRENVHDSIAQQLQRPDLIGLAVYENAEGRRFATPAQNAQPPQLDREGRRLLGVYVKDRMRHALTYLQAHPDATPYAAARLYGVTTQAVYDAIRRAKKQAEKHAKPVCPCCGQPMPKHND
jgi:hypothetical protein